MIVVNDYLYKAIIAFLSIGLGILIYWIAKKI